jgi:hypothetical protein
MKFSGIIVLNDNSASTDNIAKVLDVENSRLMYEVSNAMCIQLGVLGVLARTTSVTQVTIAAALQMKIRRQRGLPTSKSPRFMHGMPCNTTMLRNKTVHATVEVRKLKLILLKETGHAQIVPIDTDPWELNDNASTNFKSMLSKNDERSPKIPKQTSAHLDFRNGRFTATGVKNVPTDKLPYTDP